jgi:HTH-type transcriptional regulator, competence development regulator
MSSQKSSIEAARLGDWLRHLRDEKGELLKDVSAALRLDMALLSKIELGQRAPTEDQARSLAKHFRIEWREMEKRWLAEKMQMDYGTYPALAAAAALIAEQPGVYKVTGGKGRK